MGTLGFLCCLSAFGAGLFLWFWLSHHLREQRYIRRIRSIDSDASRQRTGGRRRDGQVRKADPVIERMVVFSRKAALGKEPKPPERFLASPWFAKRAHHAGLAGRVTEAGYSYAKAHYALLFAIAGALLGSVVSTPLGFCGAIAGALFGSTLPGRRVRKTIGKRAEELERTLPEMLDVIAMGLRSGLSFDRSLELYVEHFDSTLADALELALLQWTHGLATREKALRDVARSYDSQLFVRVVESVVRSLRSGVSMSSVLEETAREAREEYRAKRQEAVAKAPVKMMLPTGALILPAMLIWVLGPVMLELMGGF